MPSIVVLDASLNSTTRKPESPDPTLDLHTTLGLSKMDVANEMVVLNTRLLFDPAGPHRIFFDQPVYVDPVPSDGDEQGVFRYGGQTGDQILGVIPAFAFTLSLPAKRVVLDLLIHLADASAGLTFTLKRDGGGGQSAESVRVDTGGDKHLLWDLADGSGTSAVDVQWDNFGALFDLISLTVTAIDLR